MITCWNASLRYSYCCDELGISVYCSSVNWYWKILKDCPNYTNIQPDQFSLIERFWVVLFKMSFPIILFIYVLFSSHPPYKGYLTKKNRKKDCTFQQCIKNFLSTCFMLRYLSLDCKTMWVSVAKPTGCAFNLAIPNPFAVVCSHPWNQSIQLSVSFQWSLLFIDLESLAGELFKGISTLDAISLYSSCKIRRIFTLKSASADGNITWQMALCFISYFVLLNFSHSVILLMLLCDFHDVSHRGDHGGLDSEQLPFPTKCQLYHMCVEHEDFALWEDKYGYFYYYLFIRLCTWLSGWSDVTSTTHIYLKNALQNDKIVFTQAHCGSRYLKQWCMFYRTELQPRPEIIGMTNVRQTDLLSTQIRWCCGCKFMH